MTTDNHKLWVTATPISNMNRDLNLGDCVIDEFDNLGIVVKIGKPEIDLPDGTIYVWQSERTGYGSDNCEHYTYVGWQSLLRIVTQLPL